MDYQVFETSVFSRELRAEARMLFVPRDVAAVAEPAAIAPADTVLGVRLGVRVPDPDGLVDVLYASLQGRVYTFDPDSFGRWRQRWTADPSQAPRFAHDLVFGDRVPVSESPLRAESMAELATRGEAYVANGAEWVFEHPLRALGLVVLYEGGVLVVSLARMTRRTIVDAAEYRLRQALGLPPDWPPGDA